MKILSRLIEIFDPNQRYKTSIENTFGKYFQDKGYSKTYFRKSNKYIFENQNRIVEILNQTHPSDYGFSVFLHNKLKPNEYTILINIPNYLIYPNFLLIRDSFYALLSNKKATDSIITKKWNRNLKVFWIKDK